MVAEVEVNSLLCMVSSMNSNAHFGSVIDKTSLDILDGIWTVIGVLSIAISCLAESHEFSIKLPADIVMSKPIFFKNPFIIFSLFPNVRNNSMQGT